MHEMKLAFKRFFSCLIIFSFILFGISQNSVEIQGKNYSSKRWDYKTSIKRDEAKEIAGFHLKAAGDKIKKEKTKENNWSDDTKIRKTYSLYDSEEKVCAYAFELEDNGEDAGYVVIGANEEYSPVIEYATSGRFYDGELTDSEYLFYDGALGYYKATEESDVISDIRNEGHTYKKVEEEIEREKHTEEWEDIREQLSVGGSSNPPTSGDYMTNPGDYESGYVAMNHTEVKSYDKVRYFADYDFPGYTFQCIPVAATNLLLYWNERKTQKVNLMKGSWSNTFSILHTYFKTSPEKEGTNMGDVKPGLEKYFNDIGVSTAVVSYWDAGATDWDRMKYKLDYGEPFIYLLRKHYNYGNHGVLALGYREYVYSTNQSKINSKYSRYLCIADGHSNSADRYVNVNIGANFSEDEMVTLYFVGKY